MGPVVIVIKHPFFRLLPDFSQCSKHESVEQLSSDAAVAAIRINILHGLAQPDKQELDSVFFAPGFKPVANELRPVIHPDNLEQSPKLFQVFQLPDYLRLK